MEAPAIDPAPAAGTAAYGIRARLDRHGLVIEDARAEDCVRFDGAGRWVSWHRGRFVVRRSVMHEAFVGRHGVLRAAGEVLTAHIGRAMTARALRLRTGLARGDPWTIAGGTARSEVDRALAGVAAWDETRERAAREEALALYPEGVPIVPPHRRRDVVVEPARGCPNARCSFCAFYRGRRFEVLDDDEFAAHLALVVRHHASSLASRDGVFLGSASAASLDDGLLVRRLDAVTAALGRLPRGVAAFLDPDRAPRRDASAWQRLVRAGLVDVTVGLETGDARLRAAAGKHGDVDAFVDVVRRAKSGGVRVAVSVLVGLGGTEASDRHRDATAEAVHRMTLDADDLVYLSPLSDAPPSSRGPEATHAWREALAAATPARAVPYGAEAFVSLL